MLTVSNHSIGLHIKDVVVGEVNYYSFRFPSEAAWQRELHRESLLQLLLSAVAACCSQRAAPSLVNRMLRLLAAVAGTGSGTAALLLHELPRDLWLPLADLPGMTTNINQ